MEISDADRDRLCEDRTRLTLFQTRKIPADGTVRECRCSCLHDRGDWDYYQLICGHYFHTRCLRAWVTVKGCMNCPLCGDLPKTLYCDGCNEWGHCSYDHYSDASLHSESEYGCTKNEPKAPMDPEDQRIVTYQRALERISAVKLSRRHARSLRGNTNLNVWTRLFGELGWLDLRANEDLAVHHADLVLRFPYSECRVLVKVTAAFSLESLDNNPFPNWTGASLVVGARVFAPIRDSETDDASGSTGEPCIIGQFKCRWEHHPDKDEYLRLEDEDDVSCVPLMVREDGDRYVPYWVDGESWHFSSYSLHEDGTVCSRTVYKPPGWSDAWGTRGKERLNEVLYSRRRL